jgi:hypothetical protein
VEEGPAPEARGINEVQQIVCVLVPYDQPLSTDMTPTLLVLANLNDRALIPIDPNNTNPAQNLLEVTELGDVLVLDGNVTRFYEFDNGEFIERLLPNSGGRPSFNTNLDFSYDTETAENGRFVTDRLFRTVDGHEELLWERRGKDYDNFDFIHLGISENESVFTAIDSFEGGQVSFPQIPFHVISPTERIQLTEVNADGRPGWLKRPSLSSAQTEGEEELILHLYDTTDEYQIYKPNFGARHQIVFTDEQTGNDIPLTDDLNGGNIRNIVISPPLDNTATTAPYDPDSSGDYFGGYVAFTNWFADEDRHDCFILTPQSLP